MVGDSRKKRGSGLVISEKQEHVVVPLIAGIDAGSTETRVCLADAKDVALFASDEATSPKALAALERQYVIPSTYANVEDAKEITPQSENLEDNMDTTLVLLKNGAEKPLLQRCRVLRGRKIHDAMGVIPRYLDSSTNKTDNTIFYVNILDALGYAVMQKYNGAIPEEVIIDLTLSVRPKELNAKCRKMMNDNLLGSFMFQWKGVEIRISIENLTFSTEPEAQISGTMAVYDVRSEVDPEKTHYSETANKLFDSDCYVHIEGGGSSIGVEVVKDGSILDAASATFPLGGNYMAQLFIDKYREQSGRTVTKEAANNAIITCQLRDGRSTLDVSDIVAECKNQVALDIVERLRHEVIDTLSTLTMRDIAFISLGGRLFSRDGADGAIGDYFAEYISQLSPETEVIVLPENFIAHGNLAIGLNSDYAAKLGEKSEEFYVPAAATTGTLTAETFSETTSEEDEKAEG